MVRLVLLFAAVIIEYVYGRPTQPPLPGKDGCYQAVSELTILRKEGEAVVLSFPLFEGELKVHNIAPPTVKYVITKNNGTAGAAATYQDEGRVQHRDTQLWFLPALATDSGQYVCTYRNESYCVTGNITLHVYESSSADLEKLSYPVPAVVGEHLRLRCPSISDFNSTDGLIEWTKDSAPAEPRRGRAASFLQDRGRLVIPAVRRSHAGSYTCQLRVLVNNRQYNVSRTVLLSVDGLDPVITTTGPDLSMTSDPGSIGGSYSTVYTPRIQPPVIISPLNGTIYESLHGSGLDMSCKVLTGCDVVDSTVVTWLVNDQSVETSYLDGRALQGGRRVDRLSDGCQVELRLVIVTMTDEDVKTELKCVAQNQGGRQEVVAKLQLEDSTFTWVVVAAVAVSCFLTVVSVFLYVLFKPKRKNKLDYILARQNSTF